MTRTGVVVLVGCFVAAVAALGGCDPKLQVTPPPPTEGPNVGAWCVPTQEDDPFFAGFSLLQSSVDPTAGACTNGAVCLVNHFQGRVTCPGGQQIPLSCQNDEDCMEGECLESTVRVTCNPEPCQSDEEIDCNQPDGSNQACRGLVCDEVERQCRCTDDAQCPVVHSCDVDSGLCISRQCADFNACAVSSGDRQVVLPVCAQCETGSTRSASNAVYCSCVCGAADGAPERGPYCDCPDGFVCAGLALDGAASPAAKYCIKKETQYIDGRSCGEVQGYWGPECDGTPPP